MHHTLTRRALLSVALLASGVCASTNLTGTLLKQPFVARGAYAVVTLSRTRVHLRVDARFPGGEAISGEFVAPIHGRAHP